MVAPALQIRPFQAADEAAVIALWHGYLDAAPRDEDDQERCVGTDGADADRHRCLIMTNVIRQ